MKRLMVGVAATFVAATTQAATIETVTPSKAEVTACSGSLGEKGSVREGFTIEPWLSQAGDIRGVTVGPGGPFGTDLYVYNRTQQAVLRVTGKESAQVFAAGFGTGTGRIVFDPSGEFGGDMFVAGVIDMAGPDDPIYRVSSSGSTGVFFQSTNSDLDLLMKGLSFGKGTGFGDYLYIMDAEHQCLQRLTANAERVPFGSGVVAGSWEDDMVITTGGTFGNHAYMTDGMHGRLLRMSPAGTTTEFASMQGAISLAIGQGSFGEDLYVGTVFGDVYQVDSRGNASLFAWGFGNHSPEGNFRGIDIAGDTMWLTSDTGVLYRVTPIPEPSTLALLTAGIIGLLLCVLRRRKQTIKF